MRISHESYRKYIEKIASKLEGKSLFSPILINNETFMFPLMDDFKQSLIISLNNKSPLLYIYQSDAFYSSFENNFLEKFRKYINRFEIYNISLSEKDSIVSFDIHSIEFDLKRKVVIELIPNCPNMFLLNDEQIELVYYKNKNRNLNYGEKYIEPVSFSTLLEGELITDSLIENHFKNEIELRYKEKYGEFLKFLDTKIKSINRKISSVCNDVKNAETNKKYNEFADAIYTLGLDLKSRVNSLDIYGEIIKLDSSKTIGENCQLFYKKAKRAKETIKHAELNISNAQQSLDEFTDIKNKFLESNEKDKDKIVAAYFPTNKKKETEKTILNRPWKFNLNGTYIYFGKNASQNDYLSFVMKTDREFTWLHIKDISGSHLIICSKKPTENELLTACEFALICSHQKTGEIVYTKKKNVRRGHSLGEAIIKNQTTVKLNRIREETAVAFANSVRFD